MHHWWKRRSLFVILHAFAECVLFQNLIVVFSGFNNNGLGGRLARNLGYLVATASEMQPAASLMGLRCSLQSELTFHSRRMSEADALGMLTELSCPRKSFTA